jgi:hypothetical protein
MSFRLLYIDKTKLFPVDEPPLVQIIYTHHCTDLPHVRVDESVYCRQTSA